MLSPKKLKFKKQRKYKGNLHYISGKTNRKQLAYKHSGNGTRLIMGSYGIKALEPIKLTAAQIEACRQSMNRVLKTCPIGSQLWIRVFPDIPVTKKPTEVRMGKGKGSVDYYMTPVKAGRILFEYDGISYEQALIMIRYAQAKLPIPLKLIFSNQI
jgi:large subunit ribosomal protein L16